LICCSSRELDGIETVIAVTLEEARAIISHDVVLGRIDLDQQIDVEDPSGKVVHSLCFADAVEIVWMKRE
jgi:hypothetical protein